MQSITQIYLFLKIWQINSFKNKIRIFNHSSFCIIPNYTCNYPRKFLFRQLILSDIWFGKKFNQIKCELISKKRLQTTLFR